MGRAARRRAGATMLDVQTLREGARLARRLASTERGWSRARLIEIALEYEAAADASAKPNQSASGTGGQPGRKE